jgi:hypothetical protein
MLSEQTVSSLLLQHPELWSVWIAVAVFGIGSPPTNSGCLAGPVSSILFPGQCHQFPNTLESQTCRSLFDFPLLSLTAGHSVTVRAAKSRKAVFDHSFFDHSLKPPKNVGPSLDRSHFTLLSARVLPASLSFECCVQILPYSQSDFHSDDGVRKSYDPINSAPHRWIPISQITGRWPT